MTQDGDKMPTNLDMDFAAKTDRVLGVLDNTIARAQLALCLPLLLRNNATLIRPLLSPDQLAIVIASCRKYWQGDTPLDDPPSSTMGSYHQSSDSSNQSSRWSTAIGMVQGADPTCPESRNDPNISRALNILWGVVDIREMVKTRLLLLVSSTGSVFLEYLSRLRNCAAERLSRSPAAEREREEKLCAAWRGNRFADAERQKLTQQLEEQREKLGGQVGEKARAIVQLREGVNQVRRQCQDEVKRIVNQSERAMLLEWRSSKHRQDLLKSELNDVEKTFSATLADHLKGEKELRVKRYKVETLLMTWLQKFDADVGDKQQEFEQLTNEFETEQSVMEELEKKMAEQEEEYQEMVAEKLRYEKEEEDELVFLFASRYAARVIQRAWRAYRIRKKLAKSAKKGKGKGKGKRKAK